MEVNDKPLMASEIIGALGQPKRAIAHFKSGSIAPPTLNKVGGENFSNLVSSFISTPDS